MDKKQLHIEFMSILGESHPGLTFEEYRDSCVFLLFYQYCCLRFSQELDDSYKLKEMVRMAVRGKLQIPSFLKFIESASAYIHRANSQFELMEFSFYRKMAQNQSQEKQKSFARFIRKIIKKIDAWDCDQLLFEQYPVLFEKMLGEFAKLKKETYISQGVQNLYRLFFAYSDADCERLILPGFQYGILFKTMYKKGNDTEVFGYDENEEYIEIINILAYMKKLPFTSVHLYKKKDWTRQSGLGGTVDRICAFLPDGVEAGEYMMNLSDLPWDREFLTSKTKGEFPFILSALPYLKKKGAMVIIFPSALLYREGREAQIRKYFIEELDCLDTIMLLPDQIFNSSGQKEVLLYLQMNRKREDVMFFDCSDLDKMDEEQIAKIQDALEGRKDIPGFCTSASKTRIKENDYNLNLPRYIAKSVMDIKLDIEARRKRIAEIDRELREIDEKIAMYRRDLEL